MNGWLIFKFVGIAAAVGIITANVLTLYEQLDAKSDFWDDEDEIVRVLALSFNGATGVLILGALMQIAVVEAYFKFLANWSFLGLAMIYLAVMTRAVKSAVPFTDEDIEDVADILVYILAGTGLCFTILGCCLGSKLRGGA